MAVKKVKSEKETVEVAVDVAETEVVEETAIEEVTEVEAEDLTVEVPTVEETPTEDVVVVDTENIKTSKPTNGNVKIRMRVDHKCCIAMERYDLKADKTYTVPENVKRILNNAGLLAPL